MSELDPLEDDLASLVAAAKHVPDLARSRKAAIFEATMTKIGPLVPDGGGAGGEGGGGAGGGGVGAAGLGAKTVGALVTTFAIGIVVGITVDRTFMRGPNVIGTSAPSAVSSDRTTQPLTTTDLPPHAAVIDTVTPSSLPDAPPSPSASTRTRAVPSGEAPSSRGLAAERALLDVARSALARGEAGEALAAVSRHSREYPDGALVEEREAIAIKALVALGRRDEARTRVRTLEQRFPGGLSVRAAKAAVEGAP